MNKFKEITFPTKGKFGLISIASEIEEFVRELGVSHGVCHVYIPHATAALITNENESGVKEDILKRILALAPEKEKYLHDKIDNNARAHIIASILGPDINFPIIEGMLVRGAWQDIFFVELDGPRPERKVIINIIES